MKTIFVTVLSASMLLSCQTQNDKQKELEAAKKASIDSMKMVAEKQRVVDSMQHEMDKQQATEKKKEVVVVNQTQAAPQRKKMSNAAKGALIGAGVGAVTGAAISEKKGEGAIIGGLAGAGVGAGTGAIIDDSKKKK